MFRYLFFFIFIRAAYQRQLPSRVFGYIYHANAPLNLLYLMFNEKSLVITHAAVFYCHLGGGGVAVHWRTLSLKWAAL